ncbi:MAG: aquaporin [Halarchaeum sp.]
MSDPEFALGQRLLAEFLGSALLVFAIVSSAFLGRGMLGASVGVTVLFVAFATTGWLFVIVEVFGPISGAHVNPQVTTALVVTGDASWRTLTRYVPVQFAGGVVGVLLADLTFVSTLGWGTFAVSTVSRPPSTWLAEFLGSWVLSSVVVAGIRSGTDRLGLAVGFVVGSGIVALSSTMFVNPQVAFARIFTSSIAGVRPVDALAFAVAAEIGGIAAGYTWRYLWPADA